MFESWLFKSIAFLSCAVRKSNPEDNVGLKPEGVHWKMVGINVKFGILFFKWAFIHRLFHTAENLNPSPSSPST